MSDTWLVPGGPAVQENEDGADWLIPGSAVVNETSAAPPTGNPFWYYNMLRRRN